LVGQQSRGLPVAIDSGGPAQPFIEQGWALFTERHGQVNLSYAQCHDGLAGQRLGGRGFRRGSRTAIRCIGWNGSRWDRSTAACATA